MATKTEEALARNPAYKTDLDHRIIQGLKRCQMPVGDGVQGDSVFMQPFARCAAGPNWAHSGEGFPG